MLSIARALVARGHRVRWLAGSAFRQRVEATGAEFSPIKEGFDYSNPDNVPMALQEQRRALRGLRKLRFDLETFFVLPSEGFCCDLLALHRDRPADLVVCDSFLMAGAWWSELTGHRFAQLCCTVLTIPSRALAPFGLALPPDDSLPGRLRNQVLGTLTRSLLFRSLRRRADQSRARLGLPPTMPWLFDVVSPDLVLSSSVEKFEYPRPDLPLQVKFVGPLLEGDHEPFTPPTWWHELENATVVHVSQGTVSNDPRQLLRPTLAALADEPVLVVATTGRKDGSIEGLGPLPANVRVSGYLPYGVLLPKVSVAITNGGFQGVQAALRAGVPLVTAGSSEDKPEVIARLRRTGAAIDLGTATPEPEAIRVAVRRVLSDSSFRAAASEMAQQALEAGGAVKAAEWIEALIESS